MRVDSKDKKWTVGFVNYFTSVYLKWQLKIFYRCCNPKDFQIIIISNSAPDDTEELHSLAKPYARFNNITIVPHKCQFSRSSEQHGEGLNHLMEYADRSKYVLIQDPDFFWVGKNFLWQMEERLKNGVVAFGAPYIGPIGIGASDYPAAFGCAYRVDSIRGFDFMPNFAPDFVAELEKKFPVSDYPNFVSDVGFQIRQAKSSEPYFTLGSRRYQDLGIEYSYLSLVQEYLLNDRTFGFHLFRGCATGIPIDAIDPKIGQTRDIIKQSRDRYGRYFYYFATNRMLAKLYAKFIAYQVAREKQRLTAK